MEYKIREIEAKDNKEIEDVIAGFDEDWQIIRYKHWQNFLSNLFEVIKNVESSVIYKYLKLKYFNNLDNEQLMKIMNVNESQLRLIANYIIRLQLLQIYHIKFQD